MFKVNQTQEISEKRLTEGVFLWITYPERIPPHIGISLGGNYFSLQVNGKDDVDVQAIFRALRRRQIPALFVELKNEAFSEERFAEIKNRYTSINESAKTCLFPVLELYGVKPSAFLLPAFLKYLETQEQIVAYFALNLPPGFEGIPDYTLEDVTGHLEKMKDAEREKHIPQGGRTR